MIKMIKQPILAVISGLLLSALIYFIIDRIMFIQNSKEAVGTVIRIESYNSSCGGGRRKSKYPCTKYLAHIKYPHLNGSYYKFVAGAGSCRGSDQPITCASSKIGESTDVIYDPNNPERAYRGMFAVWGTPLMLLLVQITTFGGSFTQPKNRREM